MEGYVSVLKEMIEKLCGVFGSRVVDATELTTPAHYEELGRVVAERKSVTEALSKIKIAGPEARYDLEYSTAEELTQLTGVPCKFKGTHYWFWSPILECWEWNSPFGVKFDGRGKIVDVGCGNATLLRRIASQNYDDNRTEPTDTGERWREKGRSLFQIDDLRAVDISPVAIRRAKPMTVFCGKLQDLKLQHSSRDLIFLSYFVDRDNDQRGTFVESAGILREGGKIILEGLFPCVLSDSNGVSYGTANVTRGVDAIEDIQLVVAEFERLDMELKKTIVGERLVYSLDGAEVLPSYTLVFEKLPLSDFGGH